MTSFKSQSVEKEMIANCKSNFKKAWSSLFCIESPRWKIQQTFEWSIFWSGHPI